MRFIRPEPEQRIWERAGWSRAPKNGREWKLLKAGKPEPRRPEKPFRCRKFPSHTTYKTWYARGREVRGCAICRAKATKAWRKKHLDRAHKYEKAYRDRQNEFVPELEEGYYTVTTAWMARHINETIGLLRTGRILVEYMGDLAFEIHPVRRAGR